MIGSMREVSNLLSKKQLARVIETLTDATLVLGLSGRVEACTAPDALFGVPPAKIIGLTLDGLSNLVQKKERYRLSDVVAESLATGEPAECAIIRSDGSLTVVAITAIPLESLGTVTGTTITFTDITRASLAEAELRDSEERYRRLFEATFEGVATCRRGLIVSANPALEAMFGYEREELIGTSWLLLIDEAYRNAVREKTGEGYQLPYETVCRRKDGSTFLAELIGKTHMFKGRLFLVSGFRDLTRRIQAEEELVLERRRLDDVTVHANSGLFLLDNESRVVYANQIAEDWFGPLNTLKGKFCWQVFKLQDPERECAGLRAARTGTAVDSDAFIRSIHGEDKYLYVAATPVKDSNGAVRQVTEVVIDITERKRAEQELLIEKQKLNDVTVHANVGLLLLDNEARVTYANRLVEKWFGPSEEILGRPCWEVFRLQDPENQCAGLKAIRTKDTAIGDAFSLVTGGEERFFHKVATPILNEAGEIERITEVVIDITERVRAETATREKDAAVRRAYVDVFSAATGERLVIMTSEEIAEALGDPVSGSYPIRSYADLADARAFLREELTQNFRRLDDLSGIVTAVGEAMTNTVKHANGGLVQLFKDGSTAQVLVSDSGPGIDFGILPKATLLAGFSTKLSLGVGFTLMLDLCERIMLSTEPGHTSIVLEAGEAATAQQPHQRTPGIGAREGA